MPYPTAPGERVRFTTEYHLQPEDCEACIAGRCIQMVLSHPRWSGDVIVHDAIRNLDIERMYPLFAPPWGSGFFYVRIERGFFATGWFSTDLPDAPDVVQALDDTLVP
jgi:hypothetical protein